MTTIELLIAAATAASDASDAAVKVAEDAAEAYKIAQDAAALASRDLGICACDMWALGLAADRARAAVKAKIAWDVAEDKCTLARKAALYAAMAAEAAKG